MKKILGFFLLIILALAVFLFKSPSRRDQIIKFVKGEGELKGELELVNQVPLGDLPLELDMVGSNLLTWYGNRVKFTSSKGEVLNDREVLLNNPAISVKDSVTAVYDRGGSDVYVLNSKGDELGQINGLRKLSYSSPVHGFIALVERTEQGEALSFLSYDGVELFKKELKGRHFSAFSSSKKNSYYIAGAFYSTGLDLVPNLFIYDKEGNEVLNQATDFVPLMVNIDDEGRYQYLTDNDLYFGNLNSESPAEISLFYHILTTDYLGSRKLVGLSFGKTIGILTEDRLLELGYDGELLVDKPITGIYSKIQPFGNGFMVSGEKGLKVFEFGEEVYDQSLEGAKALTNGNMIVTVSADGVRWNTMRYKLD
ncbi:MAG: hypothetical protein GX219_08860 [Tissierellia bacterium]|nr:hypothetical protein [Tissierellia bacterium]